MKRLSGPPKDTEFVPLSEYLASAPSTFALEESPVLYLKCEGVLSGFVAGPSSIWIASDAIHFWPLADADFKGFAIGYAELVLHAIQTEPAAVYLQIDPQDGSGDSPQLWIKPDMPVGQVYHAISACKELVPIEHDDESFGGTCLDDSDLMDLESGQGDDEVAGELGEPGTAAAAVEFNDKVLGKSRRRDEEDDRTSKYSRQ